MDIYGQTIENLKSLADEKFKIFSEKIISGAKPLIGVRTDALRSVAKKVALIDLYGYLSECKFDFYEDTLIYGLLVARLRGGEFFSYLEKYLKEADSWAHIDIFVPEIKFAKKEPKPLWDYIKERDGKAEGFELRFLTVCLMDIFLTEENLDYLFDFAARNDGKGYYNDMATAWLVSAAYVKFEDRTYGFLKNRLLSDFTFRKTLSKIVDSKRVKDKEKIKALRIKK